MQGFDVEFHASLKHGECPNPGQASQVHTLPQDGGCTLAGFLLGPLVGSLQGVETALGWLYLTLQSPFGLL